MHVRSLAFAFALLATVTGVGQQSGLPAPSLATTPITCPAGTLPSGVDANANPVSCLPYANYGENDISFSATPAFLATGTVNYLQLTGNVTSSIIPSGTPGKHVAIVICQDSVGLHTFAWPPNVRGGITVATLGGKCSATVLIYVQALTAWVALGPGIVSF